MSLMENWIQSFGDQIQAVFAQNDEMGLGAVQALLDANLSEQQIRKVMGENMLTYLQTYLP